MFLFLLGVVVGVVATISLFAVWIICEDTMEEKKNSCK